MVIVAKTRRKKVVRDEADPNWAGWRGQGMVEPPLPAWLGRIHDHQLEVVDKVVKEYEAGARVVFLDAPTGSGKSLMGELVRRAVKVDRGLYVCSTKSLQEQYLRDYPYARVLKGRTNYEPTNMTSQAKDWGGRGRASRLGTPIITCADCDKGPAGVPPDEQTCSYCDVVVDCPYRVAVEEALRANVAVLNTSYLLTEANGPGKFSRQEFIVADEADLLEKEMLGYVELRLSQRAVDRMGLTVPKKGSHMTTIRGWLKEEVIEGLKAEVKKITGGGLEERRERERLARLVGDVQRVIDREDGWVRDGDEEGGRSGNGLVLKPIGVGDLGNRVLWRHGERWLCMTGTLVSAEMEAEALGLEEAGTKWGVVEAPMLFAKENRRVVFAPVGNMTRKGQEAGGVERVIRGIEKVLERHEDVNVLIHTHTYKLAEEITRAVKKVDARPVFTYQSARDRDQTLAMFKKYAAKGGAVMVAASMDRGVDLPGEMCRVQIIAKVPMMSLGSRQVSERLRGRGGELWYLVNTVRGVMQMTGRAVRGKDDWAICYVLDEHFGKVLKDGKKMGLWPEWWVEGLEVGKVREYV